MREAGDGSGKISRRALGPKLIKATAGVALVATGVSKAVQTAKALAKPKPSKKTETGTGSKKPILPPGGTKVAQKILPGKGGELETEQAVQPSHIRHAEGHQGSVYAIEDADGEGATVFFYEKEDPSVSNSPVRLRKDTLNLDTGEYAQTSIDISGFPVLNGEYPRISMKEMPNGKLLALVNTIEDNSPMIKAVIIDPETNQATIIEEHPTTNPEDGTGAILIQDNKVFYAVLAESGSPKICEVTDGTVTERLTTKGGGTISGLARTVYKREVYFAVACQANPRDSVVPNYCMFALMKENGTPMDSKVVVIHGTKWNCMPKMIRDPRTNKFIATYIESNDGQVDTDGPLGLFCLDPETRETENFSSDDPNGFEVKVNPWPRKEPTADLEENGGKIVVTSIGADGKIRKTEMNTNGSPGATKEIGSGSVYDDGGQGPPHKVVCAKGNTVVSEDTHWENPQNDTGVKTLLEPEIVIPTPTATTPPTSTPTVTPTATATTPPTPTATATPGEVTVQILLPVVATGWQRVTPELKIKEVKREIHIYLPHAVH